MLSRANQLQLLKIGDYYINLNIVSYVQFWEGDEYAAPEVVFNFSAATPDGYMSLAFRGEEAKAIEPVLRKILASSIFAEIRLPAKIESMSAGVSLLGNDGDDSPSPLDNF